MTRKKAPSPVSENTCRPATQQEIEQWAAETRTHTFAQISARLSTLRDNFALIVDQVADEIYEAMQANGFWDGDQDNIPSKLALVHSEVSEWLEANRKGIDADDKIPDYSGEEAEAADTVIRIFDLAGRQQYRLGHAIIDKMLYNLTRPVMHGKKY